MSSTEVTGGFIQALLGLGFSQYEARSYVGLLGPEPQTGYGVAKMTGVPQPKVYEALRRLVLRGAAREIHGDPVRFAAVSPEELFEDLQASFDLRLTVAREESRDLIATPPAANLEHVERLDSREPIIGWAVAGIQSASRRIYISASDPELASLREAIEASHVRGVDVVVLSFGNSPFVVDGLRVFHHASTKGAVFRAHRARHIALVVDSRETVHAVAADGQSWLGIRTHSAPIIAAVKGLIRHDIDLQQVFADFGPQLTEAYGAGLQGLESYRQDRQSDAVEVESSTEITEDRAG